VDPLLISSGAAMMDDLGEAGSDYRWNFYNNGLSGDQKNCRC
jgi:hypothetical protein